MISGVISKGVAHLDAKALCQISRRPTYGVVIGNEQQRTAAIHPRAHRIAFRFCKSRLIGCSEVSRSFDGCAERVGYN
jgi:hypothetical protein